jgi:hypothetical protein
VLGVESLEFEIVRGISSVSSTYNAKEESLNSQPVLMRVCRDQIWPRFAHTHSVSPFDMFSDLSQMSTTGDIQHPGKNCSRVHRSMLLSSGAKVRGGKRRSE